MNINKNHFAFEQNLKRINAWFGSLSFLVKSLFCIIRKSFNYMLSSDSNRYAGCCGLLIGFLSFFVIIGYHVLNPMHIGWLVNANSIRWGSEADLYMHYQLWKYFSFSPWHWPLGLFKGIGSPTLGYTVVSADIIPLVAIPLKLFSHVLPENFQYFGLWWLLNYTLVGYFSAKLLTRFSNNIILTLIGVLFFILMPSFGMRFLQGWGALGSNWLVICALNHYYLDYSLVARRKWILLLSLAVLIHFYLFAMVGFIFLAYIFKYFLLDESKPRKVTILYLILSAVLIVLGLMWVAGYFNFGGLGASSGGGFGLYSMNLNSVINPQGTWGGNIIMPRPLSFGQGEGFHYMGVGLILMLFLALYQYIKTGGPYNKKIHLPLIMLFIVILLYSVSNKIYFDQHLLFLWHLPFLEHLLGVLRASGRLFTVNEYLLMCFSIAILIKHNSKMVAIFVFSICLFIQAYDLNVFYSRDPVPGPGNLPRTFSTTKDSAFVSKVPTTETLGYSSRWDELGKHIKHIVILTKNIGYSPGLSTWLATTYHLTLNHMVYSRPDIEFLNMEYLKIVTNLKEGRFSNNTLYIVPDNQYLYCFKLPEAFVRSKLDGYSIITSKKLSDQIGLVRDKTCDIFDFDTTHYSLSGLIRKYSQPGYVIAMQIKDDGSSQIPESFVHLMASMGSVMPNLRFRNPYIGIIVNGRLAFEKMLPKESSNLSIEKKVAGVDFTISSLADSQNILNLKNQIKVNQLNHYPDFSFRGFNIVILNLNTNKYMIYHFDTVAPKKEQKKQTPIYQ